MEPTFGDILGQYVHRSLYSHGQLATLSGVPKNSITNWLSGRVRKPHRWEPLLKLAATLSLTRDEAEQLLRAAGHNPLAQLQQQADNEEKVALFAPWLAAPPPAPFQAVTDLPYFVGRQAELTQLRQLLQSERHLAIVGLFGMGGVGKTSLAAHLAYELRDLYPDGVLWARLDSSHTLAILNMLAGVYGETVSQYTTIDSRSAVVRGLLAHKRALLILDNAESSEQLLPLLPPSTGACTVLVTTRHDLTALDGWPQLVLQPFAANSGEALALFAHFLGKTAVSTHQTTLQAIADLVGHLPLALSLLAAQLQRNPTAPAIEAMWQQLTHESSRLDHLQREQRSVRLTFDLSYGRLAAEQQQLFGQLAALGAGSFDAAAVAAVAQVDVPTAVQQLDAFYKLSLLQTDDNGRFRLHQLLRDYAREKLAAQPDAQATYGRMVQYFIDHIALQAQIASSERLVSPADIAYEVSHLHTALVTIQEQQLSSYLPQAVRAFFLPLYEQGVWVKMEEAIEAAISLASETADFDTLAEMLTLKGKLLWGREEDGTATARQAVMLAQRVENPHLIADALRELGSWLNRASKFTEAEQILIDALQIAEMINDQVKIVGILNNLGLTLVYQQQWQKAQTYLERGHALAQAIGYHRAFVVLASNLGMLWAQQGEWETAVFYFTAGANIGRQHDCLTALMGLLGEWGYEAIFANDLDTAHHCFTESLDIARKHHHQVSIAMRLSELGEVARRQGDYVTAIAQQAESLAIVQREKLSTWQAIVHLRLALVAADQNKLQMARAEFEQGMKAASLLHATYDREVSQIVRQLQGVSGSADFSEFEPQRYRRNRH